MSWPDVWLFSHRIPAASIAVSSPTFMRNHYRVISIRGELLYHLNKQMFMVKIEELHTYIYMDIHECIDYLISGKFSPFPKA